MHEAQAHEIHTHVWTATIAEGDERASDWLEAHHSLSVPITSPIMAPISLDGLGVVACYEMDLLRMAPGQTERIARVMARRFGLSAAEVLAQIAIDKTIPVRADGVTVSSCCAYVPLGSPEYEDGAGAAAVHELLTLRKSLQPVRFELDAVDAYWLMGLLQIALKHPGVKDDPLIVGISLARSIQEGLCPPGSALERIALMGWTGR